VQVDPFKPTFDAPGTKRLKLKYDEPLSNVAFESNLRRYIMVRREMFDVRHTEVVLELSGLVRRIMVGRCRLTVSEPELKAPMASALETVI